MKILIKRNGIIIADRIERAGSLMSQLKGLIGRRKFENGSAMIFPGCKQIHTFFMQFPIDILFVDKNRKVIKIIEKFQPGKISAYIGDSADVIELPSHTIYDCRITIGDELVYEMRVI
ncbi:MAG: DUF192 domain-containing protein [Armatimonadota bacterium]